MALESEIQPGKLFRHNGGLVGPDGRHVYDKADENYPYAVQDRSKVWATQWQINEKHPQGREYQAARELKIADLTAIED